MNELFKIASNVSTPLALGGLFAAIVFLIFRQIIKKDIFPTLSAALGGDIIKRIIDKLFVLALIAMVLGFIGYLVSKAFPAKPLPPPDSISVNLPDGLRLRDAITFLAQADGSSVQFATACDPSVLQSLIHGGVLSARDAQHLMESLQFRIVKPPLNFRGLHVNLKERGLYEVTCD